MLIVIVQQSHYTCGEGQKLRDDFLTLPESSLCAIGSHWVGSYQPARFWLQKRIGRILNYEDVRWYQRVVDTIAEELRFRAAEG